MTPPHNTTTNVRMYATILRHFAVISIHAWLAIDPESVLIGGSRNTSHPFVSCTVLWLEESRRVSGQLME